MTRDLEQEIKRVIGDIYEWQDIPAITRQEWLEKGLITEEEFERLKDERFDFHPRPEEVEQ